MKYKLTHPLKLSNPRKIIFSIGLLLFIIGIVVFSLRKYRENQFSNTIVCVSGDCVSGVGKIRYPNGEIYSGSLTNKIPNGKGKMDFIDKGFYQGDWARGQVEGFGIYTYPNGDKFSGKFRKNKREGYGKFEIGNHAIEGEWKFDLLEGEALLAMEGEKWKGVYKRGKLVSGHGILFYPGG